MDKGLIITIICGVLSVVAIFASVLYWMSYNSYMKDIDRRIEEAERKEQLKKSKGKS